MDAELVLKADERDKLPGLLEAFLKTIGPDQALRVSITVVEIKTVETKPPLSDPVELVKLLNLHMTRLGLSCRAENCLAAMGIEFVGQLVQKTETDILRCRNVGKITLREIKSALQSRGLSLNMRLEGWKTPQ